VSRRGEGAGLERWGVCERQVKGGGANRFSTGRRRPPFPPSPPPLQQRRPKAARYPHHRR
jgi:hypothetical protein